MNTDNQSKVSDGRLGQQYAFATASLILGITSFVHCLGLEKALLAIVFGVLALRPPGTRLRRAWALAGITLGAIMIVVVLVAVIVYREELAALITYFERFG